MNKTMLRAFQLSAELGSFSQAAEQLGCSRQLVSSYISRLEEDLEIALFQRTTAAVTLTPAGELYQKLFWDLEQDHARLEEALASLRQPPTLQIQLGVPYEFMADLLEQCLQRCAGQHPDWNIIVTRVEPSEMPALLQDGTLDVILTYHSAVRFPDDGKAYSHRHFMDSRPCVYAHRRLVKDRPEKALPGLLQLPCYIWQSRSRPKEAVFREFSAFMQHVGHCAADIRIASSPHSVRSIVETGSGITVAGNTSPLSRNPALMGIPLTPYIEDTSVICLWRRKESRPHILSFIESFCQSPAGGEL